MPTLHSATRLHAAPLLVPYGINLMYTAIRNVDHFSTHWIQQQTAMDRPVLQTNLHF